MLCVAGSQVFMCHIWVKGFLDLNFNEEVIDKISNFHKITPNFTYHTHLNHNCLSITGTFLDQLLLPYKFYGRDMSGIYFFIFASCELLTEWLTNVHQDGIEEGPIPPTLLKLRENERKNWDQKECNMI